MPALVTIVETELFQRDVKGVLAEDEIDQLKDFLAKNPNAGNLIPGTGGVRKLRWGVQARGKRGGGRVIYYFHSERIPLFLFKFFAKSEKSDLTGKEKKELSSVVDEIIAEFIR